MFWEMVRELGSTIEELSSLKVSINFPHNSTKVGLFSTTLEETIMQDGRLNINVILSLY